jgi:predicted small integral membrane protein
MLRLLRSERFAKSKRLPLAGLWIGLLLWSLAFITVGGEWFLMWESPVWNGELAALRGFLLNAALIVFFRLPE